MRRLASQLVCAVLAVALSGCEEPGLALSVVIPDPAQLALVSRVEVVLRGNVAFPIESEREIDGVLLSSHGVVRLTWDKTRVGLRDRLAYLLQPTGGDVDAVSLTGYLYDAAGETIGGRTVGPVALSRGRRSEATLELRCAVAPGCTPVRTVDLLDVGASNLRLLQLGGEAPSDRLTPIAAGNLDATQPGESLILAAPEKGHPGTSDGAGAVYVLPPRRFGLSSSASLADRNLLVLGRPGDRLGSAAAVADLDGDNRPELLLGAFAAIPPAVCARSGGSCNDRQCCRGFTCLADTCQPDGSSVSAAGAVYIISGARIEALKNLPPAMRQIDLGNDDEYYATPRLYGSAGQERLGSAIAVGNIYPGPPTLVLGAPGGESPAAPPQSQEGRVYLVQLGALSPSALELGLPGAAPPAQKLVVYGAEANAAIGGEGAIALADLDGDGAELALGSPVEERLGAVRVLASATLRSASATGAIIDLAQLTDVRLRGPGQASRFGERVAFGGGDGGLAVSASGLGKVLLYPLAGLLAQRPITVETAQTPPRAEIRLPGAGLGGALAAGTFDGDGSDDDLVIGAPDFKPDETRERAGGCFVVLGSALAAGATVDLSADAPASGIIGRARLHRLGTRALLGRFDLDSTFDSLVCGAEAAGNAMQGEVYALENRNR